MDCPGILVQEGNSFSQPSRVQYAGSQQLRASTRPASSNPNAELLPHQAEGLVDNEKVVTSLRVI